LRGFSSHTDRRAGLFPTVANFGETEESEYRASPTGIAVLQVAICQFVRRQPEGGFFIKMHLVMTVVFAGFCSQAALADPEADFWQQPQVKSSPKCSPKR